MRLRQLALGLALPFVLLTACGVSADDGAESADSEINYRSTAGREFELSTVLTFAAPDGAHDEAAIEARATELRNTVTSAISAKLDQIWPEEQRTTRAGLAIQFRQASATFRDLTPVENGAKYTMTVAGEFSAVNDIEQKLPLDVEADGKKYLKVTVADLGDLHVHLAPIERSLNAYPKYMDLFADGLDIGVHFGGDHDDPPQDINHARSMYDDLVASGFHSPVARFEDLRIDSPPLTKKISVKGAPVDVRVRIFHVDMTTADARQPIVDAYKASMKNADVIIYDGHAGRQLDWSGVVLAYKPARVSITAAEFKDIESPPKQQIYVFNGCETYTGYADELYENPNRNTENTDVITTGNFSAIQPKASQVIAFVHQLIDAKPGTQAWVPRSWDSILGKMNAVGERSWVHVYGVTGIDDDPRTSPLADPSKLGVACTADADCGAPDSRCIAVSAARKVCGIACADSTGCPNGTKCLTPRGLTTDDLQCAAQ